MIKKAARFFRVSSKEQEEGYSLEAQEKACLEHERRHGLEIIRTWAVAETAKSSELRKAFQEFVRFMRDNTTVKVMLFEKPDRMTRNFRDLVMIYDLIEKHGKEVHFFKTGLKLDRKSKSSDQIQLDIQVVLARNFINNLREEVLKGMNHKFESGGCTYLAPPGFRNNKATAGVDKDEYAPLVKKCFELMGTGRHSLEALVAKADKMGLRSRHTGKPLFRSTLYALLKNPFYCGRVRWKGEVREGRHEPLISKALFNRVQEVLACENKPKVLNFAFRGIAVCGTCGSSMTAERHRKKQLNGNVHEYVYYHCTGWKNGMKPCKESYIREEELALQLGEPLKAIKINAKTLEAIKKALRESFSSEQDFTEKRLAVLKAEEKRLKKRLDQAYADKLDGILPQDEYIEKSQAWREKRFQIQEELRKLEGAHDTYLDEANRILDLARRAHELYTKQKDNFERRKLIDLMVSKVVVSDKKALSNLREPFETLSKVALAAKSGCGRSGWYARKESNLQPLAPEASALSN